MLVDGQITQLIQAEYSWSQVFLELRFQPVGRMGSGEGVDGIDGGGEEDGFSLETGGISQGGGQVGFTQAYAAEKNDIGFVFDKFQPKEVLHGHLIDFLRPTPLKLIDSFQDGEARQADAALDGAVVPGTDFTLGETVKIVKMGPVFAGRLVGQVFVLFQHKGEAEELQMGCQLLRAVMVGFAHDFTPGKRQMSFW